MTDTIIVILGILINNALWVYLITHINTSITKDVKLDRSTNTNQPIANLPNLSNTSTQSVITPNTTVEELEKRFPAGLTEEQELALKALRIKYKDGETTDDEAKIVASVLHEKFTHP